MTDILVNTLLRQTTQFPVKRNYKIWSNEFFKPNFSGNLEIFLRNVLVHLAILYDDDYKVNNGIDRKIRLV